MIIDHLSGGSRMLILGKPDTKYHSVEEMIQKSGVVVRRVYQDKVWSILNEYRDWLSSPSKDRGYEYTISGEPIDYGSAYFSNPFGMPNQYSTEIFGETIENTVLQTPLFKTSRSFLQKISVRHNYQEIVEKYINDLLNDGLNNPYTYATAIVYFLELCHQWNFVVNRQTPDTWAEREDYYFRKIQTYCYDITAMAVQKAMARNDAFHETYDLDTLFYDELEILDHTICDVLWCMRIGVDVCPLEDGLSGGEYEYFEDSNNEYNQAFEYEIQIWKEQERCRFEPI